AEYLLLAEVAPVAELAELRETSLPRLSKRTAALAWCVLVRRDAQLRTPFQEFGAQNPISPQMVPVDNGAGGRFVYSQGVQQQSLEAVLRCVLRYLQKLNLLRKISMAAAKTTVEPVVPALYHVCRSSF
ncbi:hypothetical protein HPB47_007903, partial [Ixodes persulcatus]